MNDPSPTASEPTPPPPPRKRLNTFQLLGVIMAGVIGVRRTSDRAGGVSDASTGAVLGAVLVFLGLGALAMWGFVRAVKHAAGM